MIPIPVTLTFQPIYVFGYKKNANFDFRGFWSIFVLYGGGESMSLNTYLYSECVCLSNFWKKEKILIENIPSTTKQDKIYIFYLSLSSKRSNKIENKGIERLTLALSKLFTIVSLNLSLQ